VKIQDISGEKKREYLKELMSLQLTVRTGTQATCTEE
jgi:hypothetical protein